ncbi:acyl carrier protein [Motilimonas pumila]|uniref:Acyl carrier protein n=1 Tax=Motilimonas pumila TaxID=2303987 RepID=A0A418YIG6_9GAMM|nr:acyl carrier protein [Motilimonas pumila]RJG50441.1 acyl carrier protein [Motilimonas pumila]
MLEQQIQAILVDVLGVEPEEVNPAANLVDDLAAESIDFVDIIYSLEQAYQLKINPGDIFPAFLQQQTYLDAEGNVSDDTLQRLTQEYPHFDQACLTAFSEHKQPQTFFNVSSLIDFIQFKQAA